MATQIDLRWRVSRSLRDLLTGSASAGTASSITDATRNEPADNWAGCDLWLYAGAGSGNLGTISSSASTGVLTFSPSLASAAGSTTRYELHWRFGKGDYDGAINAAIRRGRERMQTDQEDVDSLTGSDVYEYTLPASVAAGRVYDVLTRMEASPTRYAPVDLLDWDVRDQGASKVLRFTLTNCVASGSPIMLRFVTPQAELSADADAIMDEAQEFVAAYALADLHEELWARNDIDAEDHGRRSVAVRQRAEMFLQQLSPPQRIGKLFKGDELRQRYTLSRQKGDE